MANAEIANKLKEARIRAGFTQKQVYEILDVPQSTFSSWEVGKSEPDAATFLKLCGIYGIRSIKELGVEGVIESLSASEQTHIEKLRALDAHGKDVVTTLLEKEHERIVILEKERFVRERFETRRKALGKALDGKIEDEFSEELIDMKVYNQHAAAGLGAYLDDNSDNDYDMIEFNAGKIPRHADFGIRIKGKSMEPEIEDGEIIWVEAVPFIEDGEIGIFVYEEEAYCKQLDIDRGNKKVTLVSLNDDYEDIKIKDPDRLKTVGRVLFN